VNICLICHHPYQPFLDFGRQPLGNGFLTPAQFAGEYFFRMQAAWCSQCGMVQLVEQPDPKMMFHDSYAFYSSTSAHMIQHFSAFADQVTQRYLAGKTNPLVVEVGCNDGILLKNFLRTGTRHLGIEPSANVAAVAQKQGLRVLVEFFNPKLAQTILAQEGPVNAVLSANVMNHIPDMNGVFEALGILLAPDGVAVFEDPYLGAVLHTTEYDQFYDEHVFSFSATAMQNLAARHGFELIACDAQETHGGSMRYSLARRGKRKVDPSVRAVMNDEQAQGFERAETYAAFAQRCEKSRSDLVALLKKLKAEGKRVVGYAATAKSTTITNFCGIGPDLISCIYDTTPLKQGKCNPGQHIPVVTAADFSKPYPDYAVLFAHNHKREIFAKEKEFLAQGGQWILFVPEVTVLGKGQA
jgi:methylation protein EvaC